MLRFLNASISSVRGRSGTARVFLAGFARTWLVAVAISHLVLTSSVFETPPAVKQPDFFETHVLPGVFPNVTFDFTEEANLNSADGDLNAADANLKTVEAISKAAKAILDGCSASIASYKAECDKIGEVPLDKCTFDSVIRPWALAEGHFTTATMAQTFPQYVSPAKEVRDAAVKATRLIDAFLTELSMREDLFLATSAVSKRPADELARLTDEERRFIDKKLLGFKQSGLHLDDEKRAIMKDKRGQTANLCTEYVKTMSEDATVLLFSAEELDGATERFLNSLSRDEATGKYRVTMKGPDKIGVLRHVHSEAVRQQVDTTGRRICEPNQQRLADAVKLRHECAELLGYPDHATFRVENNMAKEPSRILSFLQDLQAKLTPFATAELARLTELKAEKTGVSLDQVQFHSWDYSYYTRLLTERDYELNGELVREYFSLKTVTSKMLSIFEEVLGLRFREITDAHVRKLVWHKDVTLWEVWDAEESIQPDAVSVRDAFVGHFYLDLFPRDGKVGGSICWDLQPGFQLSNGTRQFPVAAIVTNFTKPTDTEPSLLRHAEVKTLFHELGHAMHGLCSRAQLSRFHGVNVERDFLEIPSQLFENWCWNEEMLTRLSQHYVRENESLPPQLCAALVKTKSLNAGLMNLYWISLSLFDLAIHGGDEYQTADAISNLYERLQREVSLTPQPENVWPAASFRHMMAGYDAGFYGYLWSEAISTDIFYSHFANTLATPAEAGRLYRDIILRPGGTKDGMDMLFELLGREPNSEPFLRSLGLTE